MDIEQLRAYVAAATHRSISAAAQELNRSQPTVSRLIQRLERELGVPLLVRDRRPLTTTQAGNAVLRYAERALAQWQDLRQLLHREAAAIRGRLRIAASTTPGELILPRLLAEFTHRYPEVEPSVAVFDTEVVAEQLAARRYDLGFIGAPVAESSLTLVKIAEDRVVLAVPAGHPFARRSSIRLEELAGQPLIARESGSGTFRSLLRRLSERGLALPDHPVAMVLGSTQAIVSAVRAGLGMGFVSNLALAGFPPQEIKGVLIEGVDLRRALYLAYEESRISTPLLRGFVRFIRERAQEEK